MKKTVSILLLVLMVLPIFSQLTSFAAAKVAVSADNVGEVVQGTESVEVPVRISASPRWSAISFNIGFDPDSLHFKSITLNPELRRQAEEGEPNIYAVNDTEAESGNVIVGFAGLMNANGYIGYHPGEYDYFCIVTFDVDADAECGDCAVTLYVTSLNGIVSTEIDPTDVPFTVTSGGMTVLCNHDWQLKETVPATCEDDGYESYACSRCTDTKTEVLTKLGHEWGEWVQISSATCVAKAVEERVCNHNKEHTERRDVGEPDPEAHEWGEWQVTTPATCVAKAVETRVCVHDASHTETREVGEPDPEAHEWGEWEVTTPATLLEDGLETRYCLNDREHFETRIIPRTSFVMGDIDRDGEVTVSDALRALRFSVGITVPTDDETVIGDMDRDGLITVTDALAILRLSVGLVSEL